MEVRPCGTSAVLIDVLPTDAPRTARSTILDTVLALHARLTSLELPGIIDIVPAAQTVLITFDPAVISMSALSDTVSALDIAPLPDEESHQASVTEIPVDYSGPDLRDVAELAHMSISELIQAHTSVTWTAAFGGFAPGFMYLVPQAPLFESSLEMPRRSAPRTAIPAGSVGLAGSFSAVYPRSSPGGWQLIGSTSLSMWDVDRSQPCLLKPGDHVRFVGVDR